MVLAEDLNSQARYLGTNKSRWSSQQRLDGCRSDNNDCFLHICVDHNPFLTNPNFRHSRRRHATQNPPSSTPTWTQLTTSQLVVAVVIEFKITVPFGMLIWTLIMVCFVSLLPHVSVIMTIQFITTFKYRLLYFGHVLLMSPPRWPLHIASFSDARTTLESWVGGGSQIIT